MKIRIFNKVSKNEKTGESKETSKHLKLGGGSSFFGTLGTVLLFMEPATGTTLIGIGLGIDALHGNLPQLEEDEKITPAEEKKVSKPILDKKL